MLYQILVSLQVKRCAIITYKHPIYELPHELPNYLKLRTLGSLPSAQVPCQNENFVNASKKLLKKKLNFSR